MPIYEYQCQACQHKLEALQKMSDAPLSECPSCGAQALQKLVSAASFKLKGSGWYETDFKNKGKQKENKEEPKDTNGSASTGGATGNKNSADKSVTAASNKSNSSSSSSSAPSAE